MDALIHAVAADLLPLATARQLRLSNESMNGGPGEVGVRGDEGRLRQVMINIIGNAIAHAPPSTDVIIRTRMILDTCRIEVEDRGPGIPEADRERVFERFVRLDDARNRENGGAGLGLSIARSIAVAHGGSLTLHSGANGRGILARLDLPVSARVGPDWSTTDAVVNQTVARE
jgi:two-component system, OmpR family, sensor kinase